MLYPEIYSTAIQTHYFKYYRNGIYKGSQTQRIQRWMRCAYPPYTFRLAHQEPMWL